MKTIINEVAATIGDFVYIRTDVMQEPWIVVEMRLLPGGVIVYQLGKGAASMPCYGFEFSTEPNFTGINKNL